MRVSIIGAGSWGTTMASLVSENADVVLWARRPDLVQALRSGTNPDYLPGIQLPPIEATTDLEQALAGADAVLVAVPSHGFRAVLEGAADHVPNTTPVLSLTKGIERGSHLRMTEVVNDVLAGHDPSRIGVLSGPNLAREIVAGEPAATVIAIADPTAAGLLQSVVMTPRFRVYTNPDVVGAELAGATKNVMAIAVGIIQGLGFGLNTVATTITRALAEITRLGIAMGGDQLTFGGLAGVGDLMATCMSDLSRNHQVGLQLGEGRPLAEIIDEMRMVAEGVKTTTPVLEMAAAKGIELPIAAEVGRVLEGGAPSESVVRLMGRDPKAEGYGLPN